MRLYICYTLFICVVFCGTKGHNKEKRKGGGNMAARSANVNVRVEPNVKKQPERGESVPYEEAFDRLMKGL